MKWKKPKGDIKTGKIDGYGVGSIIILIIVLYYVMSMKEVNAYTISRNRIIAKTVTTSTLPQNLTIDRRLMEELNGCHAPEGAGGYQTGYADACDWLLSKLGIRQARFKSRPPTGIASIYVDKSQMLSVPIQPGNLIRFNTSQYAFDMLRHNGEINDARCLYNWSDSYKRARYNLTYWDNNRENFTFYRNVSWDNVTYIRSRYRNVTYASVWENWSKGSDTDYLRIYVKKQNG